MTIETKIAPASIVEAAASLVDAVRAGQPRVHAITNAAAQVFTANLLLAAGAIPSLTYAVEEVESFTARCDALLVNLGTLDAERRAGMGIAIESTRRNRKPYILDPVFVERSPPRLELARALLEQQPTALRCNAAEFEAISGVEASPDVLRAFALEKRVVVAMTGETDIVTDGERLMRIANGHPLMTKVTAMGCAGTGLVAAFCAIGEDAFLAAAAALLAIGVAGERAAAGAAGPGSFQPAFLDALYNLDAATLHAHARIS